MGVWRTIAIGVPIAILAAAGAASSGSAYTLHTLHAFCSQVSCADGWAPLGALVADSDGNLFGTASKGGANGHGAVYELVKKSATDYRYKVLYSLCQQANCADGDQPVSSLIIDTAGNLYGTTVIGGTGYGVAYELSRAAPWRLDVLYAFCQQSHCSDGGTAGAPLTYAGENTGAAYDGTSQLYGTAGGGTGGGGVAFQLTFVPGQAARNETVLYNFCSLNSCADGSIPVGGLTVSTSGALYGATLGGGANGYGTMFRLKPNRSGTTWNATVLHTFCSEASCGDGYAASRPRFNDKGAIVSATVYAGPNCSNLAQVCGELFRLVPRRNQSRFQVSEAFCARNDCRDGAGPVGELLLDGAGNIFGATVYGGGNDIDQSGVGGGTVFEVSGSRLHTLYRFCAQPACADGEYPQAALIGDSQGNLFGTAYAGGAHNGGTVFELSP
jgi:uncharacterized repeat protein (TIGR03803 family)